MSSITFYTLDVFTGKAFTGNPLAVVTGAEELTDKQMQAIAKEFNLSETVFLSASEKKATTHAMRIFTPLKELQFAGHPIIGSGCLLEILSEKDGEKSFTFEIGGSAVSVHTKSSGGQKAKAHFISPFKIERMDVDINPDKIAPALNLNAIDILTDRDFPILFSQAGFRFLFVPVRNKDAIKRCSPNLEKWDAVSETIGAESVYAFTYLTTTPKAQIHARGFAPLAGIPEDPATGSAATALAGYICAVNKNPGKKVQRVIEQGFEMNRPSMIEIEFDVKGGKPESVKLAGESVIISKGELL